jgi:endo-1,4-beta-xylanase
MKRIFISTVAILLGICASIAQPGLKDAYKDYYYIGAAINGRIFTEQDAKANEVLLKHFNSITPENEMKWERIHPKPGVYNFDLADKFVAYGEKNKMFIVGHCLLWHSQTPQWVFTDSTGKNLSREALLERMRDHITTIVTRYKGRINGWDVVNEALNEDGTMRKSKWYNLVGEDFIEKAFEYAYAADPKVELYYNDYNIEMPAKRAGAIRIIKNLKAKGIKISGVGIQGHWHLPSPSIVDIDSSIMLFGQLGVKVHITELDVNVLPNPQNFSGADVSTNFQQKQEMNPYTTGLPDSMQLKLTQRYVEFFKVFNKHKAVMARVTTWGIDDNMSWLNGWPIRGRTNYPLLFDREYKAKPVVTELIKLVSK